ncbi:MAG: glutamate--tRNA ligase [Planctomycetota bacterium]
MTPVRCRIAPSPTGPPHVGTAYVGLFNWALARKTGGQFLLRIEDTDRERSTRASEAAIFRALHWLGLDWDEGPDVGGPHAPYRQSERSEIYRRHAQLLIERGHAYRCFCTAERLEAMRKQQIATKAASGYDGLCRGIDAAQSDRRADREPFVVRLKVDRDGVTIVNDLLRGAVRFENHTIDDQILLKSDGFPTYHLANVVDDRLMEINFVMRAEEWITSTPKHLMLYVAFGWPPPTFCHLPLLRNADRSKISKRKNPTSLDYYREKGYLPEAMLNFLALMGWATSDGEEVFPVARLIAEFDPRDVSLGGPVFDLAKLDWLNGMYIRKLSTAELAQRLLDGPLAGRELDRALLERIVPLVQERITVLSDFDAMADFLLADTIDVAADTFAAVKKLARDQVAALLESALVVLAAAELAPQPLDAQLRALATAQGVKPGDLFMALRIAVTGKTATPPLLESMAVLGKARSIDRIQRAIRVLRG